MSNFENDNCTEDSVNVNELKIGQQFYSFADFEKYFNNFQKITKQSFKSRGGHLLKGAKNAIITPKELQNLRYKEKEYICFSVDTNIKGREKSFAQCPARVRLFCKVLKESDAAFIQGKVTRALVVTNVYLKHDHSYFENQACKLYERKKGPKLKNEKNIYSAPISEQNQTEKSNEEAGVEQARRQICEELFSRFMQLMVLKSSVEKFRNQINTLETVFECFEQNHNIIQLSNLISEMNFGTVAVHEEHNYFSKQKDGEIMENCNNFCTDEETTSLTYLQNKTESASSDYDSEVMQCIAGEEFQKTENFSCCAEPMESSSN